MHYDSHVHTVYSGHSENHSLKSIVARAKKENVEISIREHAPYPDGYVEGKGPYGYCTLNGVPPSKFAMEWDKVDDFLKDVRENDVSLGFEVDILPGYEMGTRKVIRKLEWLAMAEGLEIDAINGSLHCLEGMFMDECGWTYNLMKQRYKPAGLIKKYFGTIRTAMHTGFYDCISHLELIKMYAWPGSSTERELSGSLYVEEILKTLELAAKLDIAIEYNTSGYDELFARPYLSEEYLPFCKETGVKLVLGSDSHRRDKLARYFDKTKELLWDYDILETYRLSKRKKIPVWVGKRCNKKD